ncbi:Glycoprotein membrane GPI-anchored [Heracleum sosnowskyi]|uniref:Glycoprotein membrane GPI-anchored n=1 Tax=Heracleum sosnowskyi TaxID=360622 RepID=A0AAD8J029_9APIA|nr:Glycoprotein membrane GPI-anchored [Heracleum sosnowskyi]
MVGSIFQSLNSSRPAAMVCFQSYLLLSLILFSFLCIDHTAKCDDEEESLLQGIKNFRATFKLPTLTDNDKAECLADEIAEQFKDQPCTNTTGANTVPGTERQFSDFPDLLKKCKLNVTTTRDGTIMPACVPNLVQDIVLSNYTQSQYAASLNDTKYTGIGIGSDEDWIVVILTTGTPTGDFATGSSVPDNFVAKLSPIQPMLCVVIGIFYLIRAY